MCGVSIMAKEITNNVPIITAIHKLCWTVPPLVSTRYIGRPKTAAEGRLKNGAAKHAVKAGLNRAKVAPTTIGKIGAKQNPKITYKNCGKNSYAQPS